MSLSDQFDEALIETGEYDRVAEVIHEALDRRSSRSRRFLRNNLGDTSLVLGCMLRRELIALRRRLTMLDAALVANAEVEGERAADSQAAEPALVPGGEPGR